MPDKVFQTVIVGHQFDAVFSLREQFAALHADGKLQIAADTAAKILAYCQSNPFAREPIADIRNLVF